MMGVDVVRLVPLYCHCHQIPFNITLVLEHPTDFSTQAVQPARYDLQCTNVGIPHKKTS